MAGKNGIFAKAQRSPRSPATYPATSLILGIAGEPRLAAGLQLARAFEALIENGKRLIDAFLSEERRRELVEEVPGFWVDFHVGQHVVIGLHALQQRVDLVDFGLGLILLKHEGLSHFLLEFGVLGMLAQKPHARVPAEQRVVIAGRPDGFSLGKARHGAGDPIVDGVL